MRRQVLYTIFSLMPTVSQAQFASNNHSPASLPRLAAAPAGFSVTVPMSQTILLSIDDLNSGKILPAYYKAVVSSDIPWSVSAMAKTAFFSPMSPGASDDMPSGIVSLKETTSTWFVPLSVESQSLLLGNNTSQGNIFYIDLKVNPSWNFKGGQYYQEIIFTFTQQ